MPRNVADPVARTVVRPSGVHRDRPLCRRWVLATTVGESIGFRVPAVAGVMAAHLGVPAVVAYAVGMLPASIGEGLTRLPPLVLIAGGAIAGMALLASIGTAQWLVLRHDGYDAPWWILTTAGAWLAGLGVFMAVATPLWRPGQPVVVAVPVGVLAGVSMAGTVAVLTGFAAERLAGNGGHR